jgi:hypothetical protein
LCCVVATVEVTRNLEGFVELNDTDNNVTASMSTLNETFTVTSGNLCANSRDQTTLTCAGECLRLAFKYKVMSIRKLLEVRSS